MRKKNATAHKLSLVPNFQKQRRILLDLWTKTTYISKSSTYFYAYRKEEKEILPAFVFWLFWMEDSFLSQLWSYLSFLKNGPWTSDIWWLCGTLSVLFESPLDPAEAVKEETHFQMFNSRAYSVKWHYKYCYIKNYISKIQTICLIYEMQRYASKWKTVYLVRNDKNFSVKGGIWPRLLRWPVCRGPAAAARWMCSAHRGGGSADTCGSPPAVWHWSPRRIGSSGWWLLAVRAAPPCQRCPYSAEGETARSAWHSAPCRLEGIQDQKSPFQFKPGFFKHG